jgi:mRNA interferase RelE/StbE
LPPPAPERAGFQERLAGRIKTLADEPRPPGTVAMVGEEGQPRLRAGDDRVVYRVDDAGR